MIPGSMEQLRGLAKISDCDRNVSYMTLCSSGGVAHWLAGLYFLPLGLKVSALGWYLSIRLWRSWRKSVPWYRPECVAWSHAYLCGEMSVGDVADPVGLSRSYPSPSYSMGMLLGPM